MFRGYFTKRLAFETNRVFRNLSEDLAQIDTFEAQGQ